MCEEKQGQQLACSPWASLRCRLQSKHSVRLCKFCTKWIQSFPCPLSSFTRNPDNGPTGARFWLAVSLYVGGHCHDPQSHSTQIRHANTDTQRHG